MKKRIAIFFVFAALMLLTACGGFKTEDVVGTWTSSWVYNGNSIAKVLMIKQNGTYTEAIAKNSGDTKTENGTWEISGSVLICHPNGEISQTKYEIGDGVLTNGGNTYKRGGDSQAA